MILFFFFPPFNPVFEEECFKILFLYFQVDSRGKAANVKSVTQIIMLKWRAYITEEDAC